MQAGLAAIWHLYTFEADALSSQADRQRPLKEEEKYHGPKNLWTYGSGLGRAGEL
jgi:hypothetical protein